NVRLQRLQPLKVDLRIEAKRPPPICRETHIGETRTIRSLFQNDEADVNALVPDRIRRVAKHKEFELFQLSHLLTLHRPTQERDVAANSGTERTRRCCGLLRNFTT